MDNINLVISFLFLIEMIIKLVRLGVKEYSRDKFNLFDAFIVCISMVDVTVFIVVGEGSGGALTAFRAIRVMRVFKLSRKWKAFNLILNKIMASLKDIITFVVLMCIFIIVFIILGVQFFANTVYTDADGKITTAALGRAPLNNFDSVFNAFVTVFAVTIGEDWNSIMYDYMRYDFLLATFYFCSVVLITNIILLNLFLALLLSNFS